MKVSIVGTGYVGLVTGVCFAEKGQHVVCVDIDKEKVSKINQGVPPIFEIGLEELLKKNIGRSLKATTDLENAVLESEVTLIAVGTPFDGQQIDLSYVKEVARQIGAALRRKNAYHLVVVKSTVVPGTTDQVILPILEQASGKKAGLDFGVGMNPEFLTEGQAVDDFMYPDRIVLGGIDGRSISTMAVLYEGFAGVDLLKTNTRTAEMIKYASNAMLATQISFSNELANLSSALGGIDIVDVMKGVHLSNYLRPTATARGKIQAPISSFLEAGCGFGGSCLPKDVKALVAHGEKAGVRMNVLEAVLTVNHQQPARVIRLLKKHFPKLTGIRVTILGLAFKPDTDDMRESPAIPIIKDLLAEGADVRAYDPAATTEAKELLSGQRIQFGNTLEESLKDTQAVVLVTRWKQFEQVPQLLKAMGQNPVFVDGRRMIDKTSVAHYEGIGL